MVRALLANNKTVLQQGVNYLISFSNGEKCAYGMTTPCSRWSLSLHPSFLWGNLCGHVFNDKNPTLPLIPLTDNS